MVITGLGCALATAIDRRNTSRICSKRIAVFLACFSPALLTTTKFAVRTSTQVSCLAPETGKAIKTAIQSRISVEGRAMGNSFCTIG